MSSRKAGRRDVGRQDTFCLIGQRVLLAGGSALDVSDEGLSRHIMRRLELAVGNVQVAAIQMQVGFDAGSLGERAPMAADINVFADALGLSEGERLAMTKAVFATVAPMFRLRQDVVFKAMTAKLMADSDLAKGHAHLDCVNGFDIAVATMPAKARIAEGDVIISPGDEISIGRVKILTDFLGHDSDDKRLAAIDFSSPPSRGASLAITARGLAILDLDISDHEDLTAFHRARITTSPDAISLLGLSEDRAGVELNLLGRRETGALSIFEPVIGFRFELEASIAMPHGLFISGWYYDPDSLLEKVTVIDHSLADPQLSQFWKQFSGRADIDGTIVQASRFVAFLPRRAAVNAQAAMQVRVTLSNGENHVIQAPLAARDVLSQRSQILETIADHAFDLDMLAQVYRPALAPLQAELNSRQFVRRVREFGKKFRRRISIIIPLYKETGFIRSQLMAFNVDPFIRAECEIVYVLDDPLIELPVEHILGGTPYLYRLDIKLVVLGRNGGFASANNFGAGEAEGETLVLMNSDVIPEKSGWLQTVLDRLQGLPAFSVLGPKLLYADQSLQHAGMFFFRLASRHWQNMHYWKGYGRSFAPAEIEREVPAVTGALMVIAKADYQAVGGFTSDYVVGDYEDSDLCLKLRERGGICHYMPSVALVHFERQSMPGADVERDRGSTIYNRALHTERWSDRIEALATQFDRVPDGV